MSVKLLKLDLSNQPHSFAEKRLVFQTAGETPNGSPKIPGAEKPKEKLTNSNVLLAALTATPVKGMTESPEFKIALDKKIVVDKGTGYRVAIYAPKAWDGTLDAYLPGDTYTLDYAISSKNLRDKFIAKGKRGEMSALAVIEGSSAHVTGSSEEMSHRYDELKKPGNLNSLLASIGGTIGGEVTSINFMGHSRGGSALNNILLEKGTEANKITTISCLDSTSFSTEPLIAFARRGGQLNVAFKPGTGTEGPARRIIKNLGLTKISGNHWQSADGKVNVYETPELSHREIAEKYTGVFMGSDHHGTRDPSFVPSQADTGYAFENPDVQASPPGKLHGVVAEKLTALDAKTVSDDYTKLRSATIEDIRFNSRFLVPTSEQEKDPDKVQNLKQETYRRLKAYTSAYDKDWYTVDYAKMGADSKDRSHENFIGLGDLLLDPDIKEILVDRGGQIIKATRGSVLSGKHAGRLGFLDEKGGYVATHTGDKFRILTAEESNFSDAKTLETYLGSVKDENSKRESEKGSFAQNEDNYASDAGYYAGKTVTDYKFEPKEYSGDATSKSLKRGVPPEISQDERYVPMMGWKEGLAYWERMCGRPPRGGWLMRKPLNVFGTKLTQPNIILACMLVELEERCKSLGMNNLKFKYLTSTANKPQLHGLGLAIDFDPVDNSRKTPEKTTWTVPVALADELQKMGFKWGMYFAKGKEGTTDAMHFELRAALPNVMAMLTSAKAKQMAMDFKVPGQGKSLYEYGTALAGKTH
jgi:hypothetical protein